MLCAKNQRVEVVEMQDLGKSRLGTSRGRACLLLWAAVTIESGSYRERELQRLSKRVLPAVFPIFWTHRDSILYTGCSVG